MQIEENAVYTGLSEESIRNKIHLIRGQKVMLDYDLAEIYDYETKAFNRQVKNNIARFPNDFMFELTLEEAERSRCNISTLNGLDSARGQNIKYRPHAFTEQGIYMLMTVLKGNLAIHQSITLIRLFQSMKAVLTENDSSRPVYSARLCFAAGKALP